MFIMTEKKAELLMIFIILLRSTSFVFSRLGLNSLGMFNILALRYLIAFFLVSAVVPGFRKKVTLRTVKKSAAVSVVYFLVMTCEMLSIRSIGASATCFLENMSIVIVPFMTAFLLRRLPTAFSVAGSMIALSGVAMISLRDGLSGLNTGIVWSFLAAFLYAVYITMNAKICDEHDGLEIGILLNGFLGVFGLTASFLFESPRLPSTSLEWISILGLGILCSALGLTLQPVAQSYMPAYRAGILNAITPVSAAIQNYLILGESLGMTGMAGSALIMVSVLLPKICSLPAFSGARRLIPLPKS